MKLRSENDLATGRFPPSGVTNKDDPSYLQQSKQMIGKLFRRNQVKWSDPAPDRPFTAIGDIHGRVDLLERALTRASDQIVCVGDYIDRGHASADVLRLLQSRPEITCLIGNHEEMMLKFVDAPEHHGPRWLRYGGLQTLASFGISGLTESAEPSRLRYTRDTLLSAMGEDLHTWLRQLPTQWRSGNIAVVHAGADPSVSMPNQSDKTLKWGHSDFRKVPRSDGIWIVHGHTVVEEPIAESGVISIDTGAYATDRLTLAYISEAGVQFSTA